MIFLKQTLWGNIYNLLRPSLFWQTRWLHASICHLQHHSHESLVWGHHQHQLALLDHLIPCLHSMNSITVSLINVSCVQGTSMLIILSLPSSVLELVLPDHMASLMRGDANAGPCKKDELCPRGTPKSVAEAFTPPIARSNSPYNQAWVKSGPRTSRILITHNFISALYSNMQP